MKVPSIWLILSMGMTVVISAVATYLLAPYNEVVSAILIIIGALLLVAFHYKREDASELFREKLMLLSFGFLIGFALNLTLSTQFLSHPSILLLTSEMFMILVFVWANVVSLKGTEWREDFSFFFLGAGIISLVLAFLNFMQIIQQWLPLVPQQEMIGGHISVEASSVVNILKSLFLTSLFSVGERLVRASGRGKA